MGRFSILRRLGAGLLAAALLQAATLSHRALAVPLLFEPQFGDRNLLELLRQKQYASARDLARAELVKNPADADTRVVLAYALTELGDLTEAEANLRQALDSFPAQRREHLNVLLAEILARSGRTPEATELLSAIVGRDSGNALALASLGNLFNRTGDPVRAAEYFQKALGADPENDEILRSLLQAHLTRRDYAAMARIARSIPDGSRNKGTALYFEALSALKGRDADQGAARALLERALEVSAPTPQALTTLGYVLLKQQRPQEAADHLGEAVRLAPDFADALRLLGIAAIELRRPELAAGPLERALAKSENAELRHLLARIYLLHGRVDDGLGELLLALNASGRADEDTAELETLYEYQRGEFEQSEDGLRAALARTPDAAHLRYLLIASLLQQNRFEGAAREAQQALELHPEQSVLLLNLLALAKLGAGELEAAEAALRTALNQDASSRTTRINLSTVYFRGERFAQAETELNAIAAANPDDAEVAIRLARVYERAGKREDAERALLDAGSRRSTAAAATRELILLQLRERDYAAALTHSVRMVTTYPQLFEGYLFQAHALASLGREIDAVDALDAGFAAAGETQGALTAAASLARLHGWHRLAVTYLERQDAQFGLNDSTLAKLYATELIEVGRTGDAREVLRTGVGATDPDALLLLAMSYMADGDRVRTEEHLDAALAAGVPAGAIERQRAALGAALRIETLKKELESAPREAASYEALAGAYEAAGEYDAALTVLQDGVGKAGADLEFETQIARLLLKKGDAQRAIEVANRVLATPNAAAEIKVAANAVVGMSWVVQRDRQKAEQALELATVDGSRLAAPFYELARIKAAKGDLEAARDLLRSGIELAPASFKFYLALAALHERSGDVAASIAVYEDGILRNRGAVPLLNNVALLYLAQGDGGRALARAREALERAPEDANVLDTVGLIHLESEDARSAIPYFERAVDHEPGVPQYRYHLGMSYFKAGSTELARIELEKALDRQENAPWAPDIRNMLAAIEGR